MDQVQKFLSKFYRGVGTPLALACHMQVQAGEWGALQQRALRDPSSYRDWKEYFEDAQVIELTRKLLLPGDTDSRKQAAVQNFFLTEGQCAATNWRLHRYLIGLYEPDDLRIADFISRWRRNVKRCLGRASYNLEPRFSGGSTLSDAGKLITIPDKMSSEPTAYPGLDLLPFRFTVFEKAVKQVTSNLFFTVPKDSQKDRGCCVEASLNVMLQLACGKRMKDRYRKRFQVDLRHAQKSIHRELARVGSIDGSWATIDLSNASDTVAYALVKLLLPDDWFALLNSLRSRWTEVEGKTFYLNKFSSMGNGFTFELETIIFRTLLETLDIPMEEAYVYGDDILVRGDRSRDVISALRFFGFTPNTKKTFCEGPFRESCGGDFFDGESVRAHYLKKLPDEPQKWVALANGIRRIDRFGKLHAAWRFCVDQLPTDWRNFGPEALGDAVLFDADAAPTVREYRTKEWVYDPASGLDPKRVELRHHRIPQWRCKIPVSRKYDLGSYWKPDIALAAASVSVPSDVTTRDDVIGYKTVWVPAWGLAEYDDWMVAGLS